MRALWLFALCLAAAPLQARPYTIDDMLKAESYGNVIIDPTGRWAVVERRRPYDSAATYDFQAQTGRLLSSIHLVDLAGDTPMAPAFPQEADAGYWTAGFSPSGRQLAVYRLQGQRVSLGVFDLERRTIQWLAPAADIVEADPRPMWLDDDRLLFLSRTEGDLPYRFKPGAYRATIDERLHRTAEGRTASARVSGSGAYRELNVGNDANALVRVDLRTGRTETIERGAIFDAALSADHRRVAIVSSGPSIQPYLDRPVDPAFQGRRRRLVIEDLASGEQNEPCRGCDILPFLLSWSPTGADLLFFGRRDDEGWQAGQLYRSSGPGQARPLLPQGWNGGFSIVGGAAPTIHATWAGGTPLVLARSPQNRASQWYALQTGHPRPLPLGEADRLLFGSDRRILALSQGRVLEVRGAAAARTLLPGQVAAPASIGSYVQVGVRPFLNPSLDRVPALYRQDGALRQAVNIDPRAGTVRWSRDIPSDAELVAAAPSTGSVIFVTRSRSGVGNLMLARGAEPARTLDIINRHLADVEVPQRVAIHSVADDGRRLTHWLTLPAGGGRAPLVVLAYPGWVQPEGSSYPFDLTDVRSYMNAALLTSYGYAVLEPSVPTESASDRPITELSHGNRVTEAARVPDDFTADRFLDSYTEGVLKAVDAAAATGRIDGEHIALYGHSYGAYGAVAIAARSNRFRAVIASDGVYNLLGAYGSMPVEDVPELGLSSGFYSWFEAGQGGLGAPPWRQVAGYLSRSPFFQVERIRTAVMLIHGESDSLPVAEAEKMFMALNRIGRDALLVRYAGEGHNLVSPANIRDQWERIRAFLQEHFTTSSPDQRRQ